LPFICSPAKSLSSYVTGTVGRRNLIRSSFCSCQRSTTKLLYGSRVASLYASTANCDLLWIHLPCQICKLTRVPWIFKQYHVVRVETYCSCKFVFWKQVLHEEQEAHVSMVRSLGEQVCYSLACFFCIRSSTMRSTGSLPSKFSMSGSPS